MTKVGLIQEDVGGNEMTFRAVTSHSQAMGRTAGEALDALTSQLPADETDTLVIVRGLRPDQFFTDAQRHRLEQLMSSWRSARDAGTSLLAEEQTELEELIAAEVRAATQRAEALRHGLGS
jgi:hypothetical protein